ncbi:uncharacterized protein LOC9640239 [Selaginella moellendorffii]|uniref:uncharacterized protein LOC9640239 n=1 Tax=Selaginella moellendorffii TaxID=88036 RepID=UPI000D1CC006|nr:uncharacterized protein LOC9640239 [Selaginella moellendorffii]|eukprot:XP_002971509.2 uncharacterized protein LOC9640239 [Selaginella moellendorffii]
MMISRQRERISSNLTCLIREQRGKKIGSCVGSRREKLLGLNTSPAGSADSTSELIEEEVWAVMYPEEIQWDDQLRRHESNRLFRAWMSANWEGNGNLASPSPNSSRRSTIQRADPINVPDWTKILQQKRKSAGSPELELELADEEEKENHEWIPPHKLAARQDAARIRTSSMVAFSVLEGAGRTLKGRDLRRVRNAVWAQTGLID